ncbi:VPS9 domain-containing protein 1 [Terrapene carolina triunguis]|uniref:VPS9 domain-containing protein 1 n=1 Tax=Terrapene triunguis TaxID=2587831 RepID=A0A674JAQ5_9SAUR|nr:VPS9 domain-containing protein 1 [Terrapene carolina triunguis]
MAAGGDGAAKPLQTAMKLAAGAIELDTGNRPWEAYVEYLKSISYISQALLEEAAAAKGGSDAVTPDTPKMLKLAEQCLERAKSSAAVLGNVKPAAHERGPSPAPISRHRRVFSDEGGKLSPFLPPEIFQKLQITKAQGTKKELTPLEEASLQNQKLRAAYEARVARLNPSQAVQKTSLTLTLQRQMMENLVIAKAREETLQRKMEERRLRLQEAANRRFSSSIALTPEEQEQRALYAAILEYEQDHEWPRLWKAKLKKNPTDLALVSGLISHLLSFPEHPIAQLLKTLQHVIYSRLYPIVSQNLADLSTASRTSRGFSSLSLDAEGLLTPAPGGRRLRSSQSLYCMASVQENKVNLRHSLSTTPLSEDLGTESSPQDEAPARLADRESSFEDLERFLAAPESWPTGPPAEPPAPAEKKASLREQLKAIVKDIHNSVDRLLSLTLLAFEGLNTASSKDQCLARIEEAFFSPLWAPLLALYRRVYQAREVALSRSMERHRNMSPSELGVSANLFPQGSKGHAAGSYPYSTAVQELGLILLESCPQRKLECIVRALRVICECAEEYCAAQESRPQPASAAIGADDLLPILSYVVLKSNLPQLVAECAALEEFIHEGYLIGEEGYCLTSLQSALAYVEALHRGAMVK